jgi:hypothetical protein
MVIANPFVAFLRFAAISNVEQTLGDMPGMVTGRPRPRATPSHTSLRHEVVYHPIRYSGGVRLLHSFFRNNGWRRVVDQVRGGWRSVPASSGIIANGEKANDCDQRYGP